MSYSTPAKVLELASHYNLNISEEPFVFPILLQAAETPLPPSWIEQQDPESGQRQYVDTVAGTVQETHPASSFFEKLISDARENASGDHTTTCVAFIDNNSDGSAIYYYDFLTNTKSTDRPSNNMISSNVAQPSVFKNAEAIHTGKIPPVRKIKTLCFQSWWNENGARGMQKKYMDIYFHIETKNFQLRIDGVDEKYTLSHVLDKKKGVPLEAWDLYIGAKIYLLGKPVTLMQATLVTIAFMEYHAKRIHKLNEKLEVELAKYDKGFRRKNSNNIRISHYGSINLRKMMDNSSTVHAKLSDYRPSVANKIWKQNY